MGEKISIFDIKSKLFRCQFQVHIKLLFAVFLVNKC